MGANTKENPAYVCRDTTHANRVKRMAFVEALVIRAVCAPYVWGIHMCAFGFVFATCQGEGQGQDRCLGGLE
eukprot:1161790-Pelagomonas_calceolata.AAC.4